MARFATDKICQWKSSYLSVILIVPLLWVAVENGQRLHATVQNWYRYYEFTSLPELQTDPPWKPNITLIRSQSILLTNAKFSYLDISTYRGVSWILELKRLKQVPSGLPENYTQMANLFPTTGLYPIADSGAEHGALFQDILLQEHRPFHRLLTLQSPRHQIWAMFNKCYVLDWYQNTTFKDPNFPRGHKNLTIDFELWLNTFLDDKNHQQVLDKKGVIQQMNYSTWRCAHPQNYQSRALISAQRELRQPEMGMVEPSLERVRESYWSFDWVALTLFFHESKCLLYYRLDTTGVPPKLRQLVSGYLNLTCHCNTAERGIDGDSTEAGQGNRTTLLGLPPSILEKMDSLSRIDISLYEEALLQFLKEMFWLESQLQRRVLCDTALEKWGQELSYLPVLHNKSLPLQYQEARRLTWAS